jgi:hypothetical protein
MDHMRTERKALLALQSHQIVVHYSGEVAFKKENGICGIKFSETFVFSSFKSHKLLPFFPHDNDKVI